MFKTITCFVVCLFFVSCFSYVAKGSGMVAHWRLDNDATDSASDIDGMVMNGAEFTTDAIVGSHALVLESPSSQYVDFGNPLGLPHGRSPRSLCAWA